jgi:hypothetical protein
MDAKEAKELLLKTRDLHMSQFKGELPLAEIGNMLAQVLEFKRRKLLESCLADHPVEDLFLLMEATNALDDERIAAFDKAQQEKANNSKPLEVAPNVEAPAAPAPKRSPRRSTVNKP